MHISFSRYLKGTCSLGYLHNTFWIKVKQINEKKLSNSTSMALSLIENAFYTRERLLERYAPWSTYFGSLWRAGGGMNYLAW